MDQPEHLPPLSSAQLEIMHEVWKQGEVSVGEIRRILYPRRGISRNTVQTMMSRLEDKGWLTHRKVGQAFLYRAIHARKETQRSLVERLVETAFEGSAEGLILTLMEGRGLTPEMEEAIREMIRVAEVRRESRSEREESS